MEAGLLLLLLLRARQLLLPEAAELLAQLAETEAWVEVEGRGVEETAGLTVAAELAVAGMTVS